MVGVCVQEWEAQGGDAGRQEALLRALLMQGGEQQQSGEGQAGQRLVAEQPLVPPQAQSRGPAPSVAAAFCGPRTHALPLPAPHSTPLPPSHLARRVCCSSGWRCRPEAGSGRGPANGLLL